MLSASDENVVGAQVSPSDHERQHLTGLRLAAVLSSVSLVSFLMLLDMSILGTVSPYRDLASLTVTYTVRQFPR